MGISLAEALAQRGDMQKRLAQTQARIGQCATFIEGDEPTDDVQALLAAARSMVDDICALVQRINATNAATVVDDAGTTISDLVAQRDSLKLKRGVVQAAIDGGRVSRGYGARSKDDLREVSQFTKDDVAALRREADELSCALRKVDLTIQKFNFITDLVP